MKIPKRLLGLVLSIVLLLPLSACQRITDEVYETGRVVVTVDTEDLVRADEEGTLFIANGRVDLLTGSANTRAKVRRIRAEVRCGNYQIAEEELKPSQKWRFEAPPLIYGYNQIRITAEAEDGTTGEKVFAILSHTHHAELEPQEDADGDGLPTVKEWIFGTDPENADTDGDGVPDGTELSVTRTNPAAADPGLTVSDMEMPSAGGGETSASGEGVSATVTGADDRYLDHTLAVSAEVEDGTSGAHIRRLGPQNIFLNPSIPGYLGSAYTLHAVPETAAEITVSYTGAEIADPALYHFDPEEQTLSAFPGQRREEGSIHVRAEAPSSGALTFILLDRALAEDYLTEGTSGGTVQSLDGYKGQIINGTLRLGTGARLVGLSADAVDSDGDGLADQKEAEIRTAGGKRFVYLHADPTQPDSDFDGIEDGEDTAPLTYDVTDRTLALACAAGYDDLSAFVGMTVGEALETPDGALALGALAGSEELHLLREAEILGQTSNATPEAGERQNVRFDFSSGRYLAAAVVGEKGYGSLALYFPGFGREGAVVYAVRGTAHDQSEMRDELIERVMYEELNPAAGRVFREYVGYSRYADCGIYVTAHSTGGGVAADLLARVYGGKEALPVRSVTFNAIGSAPAARRSIPLFNRLKMMGTVVNYYYLGDMLGQYAGKTALFARLGDDKGLSPMDRDGKPLGAGETASYTYHDIQYFCTDRQLTK